jgi:hypothetical protein
MVLNLFGISWLMRGQEAVPGTRLNAGMCSYVHNMGTHLRYGTTSRRTYGQQNHDFEIKEH